MTEQQMCVSNQTLRDAGLSDLDLWLRYFELGGMGTPAEVKSHLDGGAPSAHDHDLLAQALNERFSDLGRGQPVQYSQAPRLSPSSSRAAARGERLGLLGSFSLHINGESARLPKSAQRVVGFLAFQDGWQPRQYVAGSLWGDSIESRAAGSLRSALWRLGDLKQPVIEVQDAHLRLSPDIPVDIRASEALAHRLLDDSQDLSEADLDAGLLSAELLPGWTEDWVLVRREHHTQLRLRASEALSRRLTELGRFGQAVQTGMLAVSLEPLRESAQRALIKAHLSQGNVSAARKQYDSYRKLLRDELKLKPSPLMRNLVKGHDR